MSVTVVSAYFDLSILEGRKRRDRKFYEAHGRKLIQSGVNLVLYTDSINYPWISNLVLQSGKGDRIIIKLVELRRVHPRYAKISSILGENTEISPDGKSKSPLYVALIWSKFYFLEEVILTNPFSTSHFAWVDFGLTYISDYTVSSSLPQLLTRTLSPESGDKICLNLTSSTNWFKIKNNLSYFYTQFGAALSAGIFSGPAELMLKFCASFFIKSNSALDLNLAPHEQNIMLEILYSGFNFEEDWVCTYYFAPWFGRYAEICLNWGGLKSGLDYQLGQVHLYKQYLLEHQDSGINLAQDSHYFLGLRLIHLLLLRKDKLLPREYLNLLYNQRTFFSLAQNEEQTVRITSEILRIWNTFDPVKQEELKQMKLQFIPLVEGQE